MPGRPVGWNINRSGTTRANETVYECRRCGLRWLGRLDETSSHADWFWGCPSGCDPLTRELGELTQKVLFLAFIGAVFIGVPAMAAVGGIAEVSGITARGAAVILSLVGSGVGLAAGYFLRGSGPDTL